MMLALSPTHTPSLDGRSLDELSDAELDELPYGVVALDPTGIVLRYNAYESRLARLDRNQVLGRDFFYEIAPCTRGEMFEGRFRKIVAAGASGVAERFEYLFDFRFGAQEVSIEIVPIFRARRYYLTINRRELKPPRPGLPEDFYAVLQRELAPEEVRSGVRRDVLDQRLVEVPWSFLAALRATCDRVAPESWQLFCQEWGVQWGRRTAIDLEAAALERRAPLRELPMRDVAELFSAKLAAQGWGRAVFDFTPASEGLVVVHVERSALAEAAPKTRSGDPRGDLACALLAGCLSALLSHVAGRRLAVREVACASSGAHRCAFVTVGSKRRAALDRALDAGLRDVEPVRAALRREPREDRP